MKVQYHGVVEAQPSYQHVGYCAAASNQSSPHYGLMSFAWSLILISFVMGSMTTRRAKKLSKPGRALLILLVIALLVGGILTVSLAILRQPRYSRFPYKETEYLTRTHLVKDYSGHRATNV